MCHIGGDDASGPIQVVRFDPPTAGFGAADDAWLIFGDALMVVPRAAGSAELLPSWPGATVLTVSWAASTPGEPPRCQVGG